MRRESEKHENPYCCNAQTEGPQDYLLTEQTDMCSESDMAARIQQTTTSRITSNKTTCKRTKRLQKSNLQRGIQKRNIFRHKAEKNERERPKKPALLTNTTGKIDNRYAQVKITANHSKTKPQKIQKPGTGGKYTSRPGEWSKRHIVKEGDETVQLNYLDEQSLEPIQEAWRRTTCDPTQLPTKTNVE